MTDAPSQPGYRVRPATEEDLDAAVDLAHRFYSEEGFATGRDQLRTNMEQLIADSTAQVLLAVAGNTPVAIAVGTSTLGLEHLHVAELQDLYVLPAHRRDGLASQLIDATADWARRRGCEVLDVVVDPDGDERHHLRRYYSSRGFEDEGRRLLTRSLS